MLQLWSVVTTAFSYYWFLNHWEILFPENCTIRDVLVWKHIIKRNRPLLPGYLRYFYTEQQAGFQNVIYICYLHFFISLTIYHQLKLCIHYWNSTEPFLKFTITSMLLNFLTQTQHLKSLTILSMICFIFLTSIHLINISQFLSLIFLPLPNL